MPICIGNPTSVSTIPRDDADQSPPFLPSPVPSPSSAHAGHDARMSGVGRGGGRGEWAEIGGETHLAVQHSLVMMTGLLPPVSGRR